MKRVTGILALLVVLIGLSIFLYQTGKGHEIYVSNPTIEGVAPIKEIVIKVDGETKGVKVRSEKKNVITVKGISHKFLLTYKSEEGNKELKGEFKVVSGKDNILELSKFINGDKEWITYKETE